MPTYYSSAFAAFYDRYLSGWTREFAPRLADYLARTQTAERSVLDLCCGTGVSSAAFCEAGWRVVGLDLSQGMLGVAEERLAPMIRAGRVQLINADAASFVLPERVGACISLDGALNHLDSLEQLERCFGAVSAALVEGGQFVFDLYEPAHFRHWDHVTLFDTPDAVVTKHGIWDGDNRQGWLRYAGAFGEGPTCHRIEQTLRSLAFTPSEVERALAATGLVPAECEIESTTAGMRPEATYAQSPPRTLYRAVKRPANGGD